MRNGEWRGWAWLDAEAEGRVREEPRRSAWRIGDHSGLGRRGVFLPRFGGAENKQVIPTALNGTTHKISLAIGCEPEMVVADVCIEGGTHASDAALLLCVWSNAYRLQ